MISLQKLKVLKAELAALPDPDDSDREVTNPEAVEFLGETIHVLLKRGFKLERISAILSEREVPVTRATLARYIRHSKALARKAARAQAKLNAAGSKPTGGTGKTQTGATQSRPAHGANGKPADKPIASEVRTPATTTAGFTPTPDTDDL